MGGFIYRGRGVVYENILGIFNIRVGGGFILGGLRGRGPNHLIPCRSPCSVPFGPAGFEAARLLNLNPMHA